MEHRFSDARPAPLDAGLVRAHAAVGDADAERRAGVARRQRRSAPSASPIADLILVQDRVRPTVERLVREHAPDVVGLSVMTFQRRTALRLIASRSARCEPGVRVVVGGYDPSLAPEAYERARRRRRLHRARRRRADVPRAAARARARRRACAAIPGLSCRDGGGVRRTTRPRRVSRLDGERSALPNRARARARRLHACSAGRSTSSRRRAAAPTTAASARSSRCAAATSTPSTSSASSPTSPTRAARGARAIFLVDDNITLNVARFEALCRGDRRRRPQRHRLHRPGDDLVDRRARRRRWRR